MGLANHTILIARDGTERPIDDCAAPIRCVEGQIVGCVLVFRDVSERRHLENENASRLVAARLLANIVETSNDAIISKSLDGVVHTWNAAAEQLFGYSGAQMVGQHISRLIPADRQAEEDRIIAMLKSGQRIEHYETVRQRHDGSRVTVSLTISPLRDEQGVIVGASKIARDISAQKAAEEALRESEGRFRNLADNMAQLAWMADGSGDILWYNRRWYDFTGTTFDEAQGRGWQAVLHPDHIERVMVKIDRALTSGQIWEDTFPLRARDGNYRWFLSRAVPIRDEQGAIFRWFGTGTDITEQLVLEENLHKLASDLSDADRRKDEFLATLAHELRNPLAAIHSASQLLNIVIPSDADMRETVEIVHRQAQLMVRLIDDLMDVSRITRGKIELRLERTNLKSIIDQAIESSRTYIEESHHRLTVSLPPEPLVLNADPMRIAQVFANLLNNAAKYTDDGGEIQLTASREDGQVVVSVKDSGIGIEKEQIPQLFEMFSQVHSDADRSKEA